MAFFNNSESNIIISGTSSKDTIVNYSGNVSMYGGAGDDSIRSYYNGHNSLIDGGKGNDYLSNKGNKVTINAGDGKDTINNQGDSVTINTGVGNDSIHNSGDSVTITGGKGNDSIYNNCWRLDDGSIYYVPYNDSKNVLFKYASGDGNDIIYGFMADSTLSIGGSSYSTIKSGNDVLVKVGSKTITLKNAYATADTLHINKKSIALAREVIKMTETNNDIRISRDSISVVGSSSNDDVCNNGSSVTINTGAGNDLITNWGGSKVTINTGDGKDSVWNDGDAVTINTGDGDDYIDNEFGSSVTINTGAGNDSIRNNASNVLFKYNSGDGNDVIYGFKADSTLSIGGGSYSTTKSDYGDIIVTVGNGKITLNGAASLSSINIVGDNVVSDSIGVNINNDMSNTLLSGTSGNDSIKNYASDVTINSSSGDDFIRNGGIGYTVDSVLINTEEGNDTIENRWGKYTSVNSGSGNDDIDNVGDYAQINSGAGNDSIQNEGSYVTINGGNGADLIFNTSHPDSSTINGGTGNDTIYNDSGSNVLFKYSLGDGNDAIYGFKENSTLSIGGGSYSTKKSGDDVIVTVGNGKISLIGTASLEKVSIKGTKTSTSTTLTVTNSTKSPLTVDAAIKTVDASKRTTAIKITGNALANSIKGGSGKDTISGGAGNDKMFGNAGNDSLSGGDGKDTLSGGSGNDKLLGGSGNDCIKGGTGRDSLIGGKGNDKLWGDDGKDIFYYAKGDGKDIIYGFEDGDTLTLDNLKFTASYDKSSDAITFNVSGGSVTLKDFTASTFNINNATYKISGSQLVKS